VTKNSDTNVSSTCRKQTLISTVHLLYSNVASKLDLVLIFVKHVMNIFMCSFE